MIVALLAIGLGPLPGFAQTSSSDSQTSKAKERAREERERREIHRSQDRMRELDRERAAERSRQDADWRREMNERNQRNQATRPAPTGVSSGGAAPAPGPYAPPASTSAPRTSATSSASCSARPACMAANGRANLCMGVQSSYSGANARQTGLADIVRRCREANTPEPCPGGKQLNPAAPSYKIDTAPALSCADQCTKVARCEPAASR